MAGLERLLAAVIGTPVELPGPLRARWPELDEARWRRGGLFPRVGGWCLGRRTVAAITLWRTVYLADDARFDPGLLLHELRHVHQFLASRAFPLRYLWESVRRGYSRNPYEADANEFALARLGAGRPDSFTQDV